MRILVCGAGVLGSLFAAGLRGSGHRVALLARGSRLADLRRYGLALEDMITGRRTFVVVDAIDRLNPDDEYDLALVFIGKAPPAGILPSLAAQARIPDIVFMGSAASDPGALAEAVGRERALLGHAGAGGVRVGPLIRYAPVPPRIQKTAIGEIDGRLTGRLKSLGRVLSAAGFPTTLSADIVAAGRIRGAWFHPLALAWVREDGDLGRLAAPTPTLGLLIRSIREGLRALRASGYPSASPPWVRAQAALPETVLGTLWRKALRREDVRYGLDVQVRCSWEDILRQAGEYRAFIARAGIDAPAFDALMYPLLSSRRAAERNP